MGIKKKLGYGIGAAALGLSLIGGGTFAYFNDTKTINNSFASGTLHLDVLPIDANSKNPINFDLSNMKPGDNVTRSFQLTAKNGTLAIKQVLMNLTADGWVPGQSAVADNNMDNFLKQFRVLVFKGVNPDLNKSDPYQSSTSLLNPKAVVTLYDLYHNDYSGFQSQYIQQATDGNGNAYGTSRLNIAPTGLSVTPTDQDAATIQIAFYDDGTNQNIYQGDTVKVHFNLEGTQFQGTTIDRTGANGNIDQNKKLQFDGDTGAGTYPSPHNGDRYIGSGTSDGVGAQVNSGGTDGSSTVTAVTQ